MKPRVVIVGADKGGVGKTTVASALLDYFEQAYPGGAVRAFDTEPDPGRLKLRYPNRTEVVDLTITAGQMRVLDTLKTTPITVLDMKAGITSTTLDMLDNIGFMEKAEKGEIGLNLLHILGGNTASFGEIKSVATKMAHAKHFLVKNQIADNSFFQWHGEMASYLAGGVIEIPKLDTRTCEDVDASVQGFVAYGKDETKSEVLRGYAKFWLKHVFKAFDAAKLHALP